MPHTGCASVQSFCTEFYTRHFTDFRLRTSRCCLVSSSPGSLSFELLACMCQLILMTAPYGDKPAVCPQIKGRSPVIIKCQSATSPNLQIVLPPQAIVTVATEAADGEEPESVVAMLPAKKLSRQLTPRHRLIAVVATPKDTPADNVGLQAALKADRHMARYVGLLSQSLIRLPTMAPHWSS